MKTLLSFTLALTLAVTVAPAAGQDYWERAPWEGEWERHRPTAGLEYEYEDDWYGYDAVDVEPEQYEWEPGEGYHEQEWYDPSDWFTTGRDIEYENGDYWGGQYDDDYADDDWYYDYYGAYDYDDYDYDYGDYGDDWDPYAYDDDAYDYGYDEPYDSEFTGYDDDYGIFDW